MNAINIIATNIKIGGGKELLEYLLEYIEHNYKNIKVIVYVDKSLALEPTNNRNVIIVNSTFKKISLFLKRFANVIYFGNLPPMRKTKQSIVYFHNKYLLLDNNKLFKLENKKFMNKLKYYLLQYYIKYFINNVTLVACQNKKIQEKF